MSHRPRGGSRGFGGRGRGGRGRGERGGRSEASGGYGGRRERDCNKYKLLGECDGKDTGVCPYSHRNQVPSYSEIVDIPEGIPLGSAIGKKHQNFKLVTNIAECCTICRTTSAGKVEIVTSDETQLPRLVKTYKILLSQLYPMGPQWCYLHPKGVSECLQGTLLHFQEYKGRTPPRASRYKWSSYELCKDVDEKAVLQDTTLTMEKLITKSPVSKSYDEKEGAYQSLEAAHGTSVMNSAHHELQKEVHRVIFMEEYQDHMKDMLKVGLEWLCKKRQENNEYVAKLEARFGKVLWGKLPEDVICGSRCLGNKILADLLLTDNDYARIFTTDVRGMSADRIRRMLYNDQCSHLETFDLKLTTIQLDDSSYGRRLDVRVKFEHGKPRVLLARKDEVETLIFDVICLHRNHDIKMTLNHYEVVKPDHPLHHTINRIIRTLTLTNSDDSTISFVPRTEEWNVHFIRHKKRYTYVLGDKYMVTVSQTRECELDWPSARNNEPLDVTPDLYKKTHTEIEFHNIAWECAFGRDAGFSPEQSLALHMEQPAIEPSVGGAIPHPWQPEHILKDFDKVWEELDALNETLGSP